MGKSCSSAGKPRLGGEFFLGAIGGAGAAGLLSLCSCLIFFRLVSSLGARRVQGGEGDGLGIPGGPPLEESGRYGALENRVMGQGIRAGSVPPPCTAAIGEGCPLLL